MPALWTKALRYASRRDPTRCALYCVSYILCILYTVYPIYCLWCKDRREGIKGGKREREQTLLMLENTSFVVLNSPPSHPPYIHRLSPSPFRLLPCTLPCSVYDVCIMCYHMVYVCDDLGPWHNILCRVSLVLYVMYVIIVCIVCGCMWSGTGTECGIWGGGATWRWSSRGH